MKIRRVSWTPYRIPFKSDFRTAHGPIPVREGAILRLETDDGRVGLGDIAPLPGFGGTFEGGLRLIAYLAPKFIGRFIDDLQTIQEVGVALWKDFSHDQMSVGMSSLYNAEWDLLAQDAKLSLAAYLSEWTVLGINPTTCAPLIAVNATVGAVETAAAVDVARRAVSGGFHCIKLKVGVGQSDEAEIARVEAVRDAIGPDVELRLDANGAWAEMQAIGIINALEPCNISLVEQPVAIDDIEALRFVRLNVTVPIAADEAVIHTGTAHRIIERDAADILVVKPAILPKGVFMGRIIAGKAEQAGIGVIVTSMLESGVGVAGALHLASTLKQPALACGLATTSLLEADLLKTPLEVSAGFMRVPQGPGLGVELDEDQLALYGDETVVVE